MHGGGEGGCRCLVQQFDGQDAIVHILDSIKSGVPKIQRVLSEIKLSDGTLFWRAVSLQESRYSVAAKNLKLESTGVALQKIASSGHRPEPGHTPTHDTLENRKQLSYEAVLPTSGHQLGHTAVAQSAEYLRKTLTISVTPPGTNTSGTIAKTNS
jgi:hypothetical protein